MAETHAIFWLIVGLVFGGQGLLFLYEGAYFRKRWWRIVWVEKSENPVEYWAVTTVFSAAGLLALTAAAVYFWKSL